jgi:hypothetical protein
MDNKKVEEIVKDNDNKKNKSVIFVDSRIKKMEERIEATYKDLSAKFETLQRLLKLTQEIVTKNNKNITNIRSTFYESSLMNRYDLVVCLEIVLVIGALYGFFNVVYLSLGHLINFIF